MNTLLLFETSWPLPWDSYVDVCYVIGAGLLFDCVFMNLTQCHVVAAVRFGWCCMMKFLLCCCVMWSNHVLFDVVEQWTCPAIKPWTLSKKSMWMMNAAVMMMLFENECCYAINHAANWWWIALLLNLRTLPRKSMWIMFECFLIVCLFVGISIDNDWWTYECHAACLMLVLIEFMMMNMDDEYEDAAYTLLLWLLGGTSFEYCWWTCAAMLIKPCCCFEPYNHA